MIPKHINHFMKALIASYRSKGPGLCNLHCSHVAAYYFHLDEIELNKIR